MTELIPKPKKYNVVGYIDCRVFFVFFGRVTPALFILPSHKDSASLILCSFLNSVCLISKVYYLQVYYLVAYEGCLQTQ